MVSLSNNTITFEWEGIDLDNDIDHYDLYLGIEKETILVLAENITQGKSKQQLESGTNYFWQIITVDREGNSSKSLVGEFTTE